MMKLNRHWLTLIRWLYSLPVAGAIVFVTLYGHDLNPVRIAGAAGVTVIAAVIFAVFELVVIDEAGGE
jgi:drug/metabolite transporter (DMT)-like permease